MRRSKKRRDKREGKVHDARSIPLNHSVEEGIVEGTEKTKSGSGGSTTSKTPSSFSISGPRFSPSLDRRPSSFFGSSFLVTKRAGCDVVNNKKIRTRPWRFSRRVKKEAERKRKKDGKIGLCMQFWSRSLASLFGLSCAVR